MERKECVVIGAGLAGLAAAYHLTQKRWKVTVVEATRRLGGRDAAAYPTGRPLEPQIFVDRRHW
jgi:monoamine oxidase